MAMADLTGAVGIASRRARAQGSQPPSPAGVVGKREQLALLLSRTPLAVAISHKADDRSAHSVTVTECRRRGHL